MRRLGRGLAVVSMLAAALFGTLYDAQDQVEQSNLGPKISVAEPDAIKPQFRFDLAERTGLDEEAAADRSLAAIAKAAPRYVDDSYADRNHLENSADEDPYKALRERSDPLNGYVPDTSTYLGNTVQLEPVPAS